MKDIKIKEEFKDTIIGFNGEGKKTLGERSQKTLVKLAVVALRSNNQNLLNFFDGELPPVEELEGTLVEEEVEKISGTSSTLPGTSDTRKPASASTLNTGAAGTGTSTVGTTTP